MSLTINHNNFQINNFDASIATLSPAVRTQQVAVDGLVDVKAPQLEVAENAPASKSESKGFWGSLWGGIKGIGHLFSSLGNGIKGFFGKVMDAGMWAGGKLGDGFMAFMKGGAWVAGKMREGVIAGAKAVGGFFKSVGEGFGNFFKNPWDHIKGFGSGLKALGSKFWNGALALGDKMGDGFMKFMEGGAWVAGKAREGVVKAAEAVGLAAKKVGSFIKGLF